jgi:hypothetical protein
MMPPRIRLKNSSGWFAAGREVAAAMEILSDAAFKLYLYLCLRADRQTGQTVWEPAEAACLLQSGAETATPVLDELCLHEVCVRHQSVDRLRLEICDRFWPYEKVSASDPALDQTNYVQQVRQMLLRPACVRAGFSAADERLAMIFYRRGVTIEQLQRAIWLGCARKYMALLKGSTAMLVTSLHYFASIVEEVAATSVGGGYWKHVQRTAEQMERRWIEQRGRDNSPEDGMMETK